jgi:hypothetical protein
MGTVSLPGIGVGQGTIFTLHFRGIGRDGGSGVRFRTREKIFYFVQNGRIVKVTLHFTLNSEDKNAWNYASILPCVCLAYTGTNLPFLSGQNIPHTTCTVYVLSVREYKCQ